jgi:hypothetical protein
LASAIDQDWAREDKPEHVGWMFELSVDRCRIEADWCERVADRIEDGRGLAAEEVAGGAFGAWRETFGSGADHSDEK